MSVTTSTTFGMMLLAQGIRWREGDRLLLDPTSFRATSIRGSRWRSVEFGSVPSVVRGIR